MAEIVNNDKLTLILTQYGLSRVAEVLADPSLNLHLTKIKFGSGNNYSYYTPNDSQVALKGPIEGAEFYIYKKELLEDELTISFYTVVPENIGGFDIREVGLYETVNGEDNLFAVGTCQPFVKPTAADNYFINIDYYIFLRAANFASVYDQITLDAEHALVTEPDMEEMMRTFLFANANLVNQIGQNSRIIGYNRATQLYEKITENKTSFSYLTLYKNYASLLEMVPQNSIFSFWAFDYSRRIDMQSSIVDLSTNMNYLSTTVPISSLKRVYNGFMSMFSMENANFFLSSNKPLQLSDGTKDLPFVMAFALRPLDPDTTRTLLAKSDYATETHTFEITETFEGQIKIRFFTDSDNYVQFTSNTNIIPNNYHSLVISYYPEKAGSDQITAYVNSEKVTLSKSITGTYTCMKELPGTLYNFSCTPTYIKYADSGSAPSLIFNENGSPYTGNEWTISNSELNYENNPASYSESDNTETDKLYAWVYDDGENIHTIYTKIAPNEDGRTLSEPWAELYNPDYTSYYGSDFTVSSDIVFFRGIFPMRYYNSSDIEPRTLYAWKYEAPEVEIFGNRMENPTSLYTFSNGEGNLYTGTDWTIFEGNVYYIGQEATYEPSKNTSTSYPNLTSYIIDQNGNISQPINSEVGIISIIKGELEEDKVKALSLLLCATMGINPYI